MATGTLALILLLGTTPGAGDVWHIKERSLRIPIKVDPARRNQIRELRLFLIRRPGEDVATGGRGPPR